MYVRTLEGPGQVVAAINLDRAVCLNRHYARVLGWQAQGNVEHVYVAWGQADTERCGRNRAGGVRCRMEKHLGASPQEPRRSCAARLRTEPKVSRSGFFLLWSREGLASPP